jgi:nitroimidazol reductase NimA-like FMN-containing flavoprotein (pyridoxamine 5'-phosphate oxidase superfamily)
MGLNRHDTEPMHETPEDIRRLQDLLDSTYAVAGRHLRSIITPANRLTAGQVCDLLEGMCLLALATVTADGRPLVGPVDGIFFRGAFYFGSAPDSVRFRHIEKRPHVSATHLRGEELAVTVHGTAQRISLKDEHDGGFRAALLSVYVPRYGPEWEAFLDSGPVYARIDADRMHTFHMPPSHP